jgi:hypothetical protein
MHGTKFLAGGKAAGVWSWPLACHLVPRLRMTAATHLLHLCAFTFTLHFIQNLTPKMGGWSGRGLGVEACYEMLKRAPRLHGAEPWGLKHTHTHEKLGTYGATICEDFTESESGNFLDQLSGHPFLNEKPRLDVKHDSYQSNIRENGFPLNRFVSPSERASALRQLIWTKVSAKLNLRPSKINSEQCNA